MRRKIWLEAFFHCSACLLKAHFFRFLFFTWPKSSVALASAVGRWRATGLLSHQSTHPSALSKRGRQTEPSPVRLHSKKIK